MSCSEWESGSIRVPPKAWAGLKKATREAANAYRDEVMAHAKEIATWINKEYHKKPNSYPRVIPACQEFHRLRRDPSSGDEIINLLEPKATMKGKRLKIAAITQEDVTAVIGKKFTNKDVVISFERVDWEIVFDNDTKTVWWIVPENNHAVSEAHEHPVSHAFFCALDRIDYSGRKKYGGIITGNDEYNSREGGCGDYVSISIGQFGED